MVLQCKETGKLRELSYKSFPANFVVSKRVDATKNKDEVRCRNNYCTLLPVLYCTASHGNHNDLALKQNDTIPVKLVWAYPPCRRVPVQCRRLHGSQPLVLQ